MTERTDSDTAVRMIPCDRTKPYRIDPSAHAVWVCGCGLSKNKPFCDGSHVALNRELMDGARLARTIAKATEQPVPDSTDSAPNVPTVQTS